MNFAPGVFEEKAEETTTEAAPIQEEAPAEVVAEAKPKKATKKAKAE